MTAIADSALGVGVILAALALGVVAPRWRLGGVSTPRWLDMVILGAAAASVVAVAAQAGMLMSSNATLPVLLRAAIPVPVSAGYRLAVLWATLPGATLAAAAALLVASALAPAREGRHRFLAVALFAAVVSAGVALWTTPAAGTASGVPPFAQAPAAAMATLAAFVALVVMAWLSAWAAATRTLHRQAALTAWLAATASVGAEQFARSRLGVGPDQGIVLGTASSGLLLWLATSALLHRRVQRLLGVHADVPPDEARAWTVRVVHAGTILLVVSFAVHIAARRATLPLPPGTAVDVRDTFGRPWQLVNQGISRFDADGVDVTAVAVEAGPVGGTSLLASPEIRDYHREDGEHIEPPVFLRRSARHLTQELRVLFVEADSADVATVRVTFIPAPFLWPAGLVLVAGAGIILLGARSLRPDRLRA